jgi:periplasmic copper chaperone A
MSLSRAALRVALSAGVIAGTTALALPAFAHVTIAPTTAAPGSEGTFEVRVPNEEVGADTTMVQLYLPQDHPIASVSVQPTPGWTINVTNARLNPPIKTDDGEVTQTVSEITWSGGKISPGQFQQFAISLGPMPTGVNVLRFKALQTYTDRTGKASVVRWIEIPTGGAEPDHPAPSLTLSPTTPSAVVAAKVSGSSDGTAVGLGVAGLVVGVVALGVAVFAVRRGVSVGGAR